MRWRRDPQGTMLAFVDVEERVPKDHPLRTIKGVADEALERLSGELMYSEVGRASVPPERLLKASLLISLHSVRSERAFCVGVQPPVSLVPGHEPDGAQLRPDGVHQEPPASVGAQGSSGPVRRNVPEGQPAGGCCRTSASAWRDPDRGSGQHQERRREDRGGPPDDDSGNPWVDFRGERLRNETHRSRTDPEARLMRKGKGKEARLSFMGHAAIMENGNGHGRADGSCDAGRCPAAGLPSQDPGGR